MIRIANFCVPLSYDKKTLMQIACKQLHIEENNIADIIIVKRAVKDTDKKNICFKMTIDVSVMENEDEVLSHCKCKTVYKAEPLVYSCVQSKLKQRPVVIGSGPAGLFAALILAKAGAKPILLERGFDVDTRIESVRKFWQTGKLDTKCNVQFGEGGAGTFSDGKLKTGKIDARKFKILSEFVSAGAPPEIMYLAKPHIGTDRLHVAVKQLRKKIINLGGNVYFGATVTDIIHKNGQLVAIGYTRNGEYTCLNTDNAILAIGHSARDTFEQLYKNGIKMEQKNFAVGVRIEHPQKLIDNIRYGEFAGHKALGAADYRMVVHLPNGRNVYTFCMCPGGMVVASTSEEDKVVTNGMSEYARDGKNANTAMLVTVNNSDVGSDHPLAGIEFQRKIETAAFKAGGGNYKAPVQRLEDFMNDRNSTSFGDVLPTYMPGTSFAEVKEYLPLDIADSLRNALKEMFDWMPGYYHGDALLTGAETRTTSPVRILRTENLEAVGIIGLYPCGEGAGYAGGIISAAVDGILCAEKILSKSI